MVKEKVTKGSKDSEGCKPSLTYLAIGVFVLCALLLNFVEVGQGIQIGSSAAITGYAVETSFISNLFTSWTAGDFDVNIAKYLLFGMLALFIWSALNYVKIPSNAVVQALLAIPVAFLSIAYIAPEEIFVVLTGYTALGLAISTVIPFMIMLFFSAMLLGNERIKGMSVGKILGQFVLWGAFAAFLLYKLIGGYTGADRSNIMLLVMWVILILSVLILYFNKGYRKWIRSLGIEIKDSKAAAGAAAANAAATLSAATMGTSREEQEAKAEAMTRDLGIYTRQTFANRKRDYDKHRPHG